VKLKKNIVLVLCGVLLFSSVSPAFIASAAKSDTIELNPAEINKDDLLEYAIELGVYLTDDEVIITDSQLVKLLAFQGVEIPEEGSQGGISLFREGVTKIVSRGSGSWDIYLSASFIRNYYWSIGAAATLIGVMVPGIGWGLAYAAVALVADLVSSNTQNGYVVSIRNYGISSAYMQ
jgi:hypothetical protein